MENIPQEKLIEFIQCHCCRKQFIQPMVTECCQKVFCLKCISNAMVCPNCSSEQLSFRSEKVLDRFLSIHSTPTDEDLTVFSDCALCYNLPSSPVLSSCCFKIFCSCCLKQWVNNHNDCPMCRQAFQSVKFHDYDSKFAERSIYFFDVLKKFFDDVPRLCKFGCGNMIQISKIEHHLKDCPMIFKNHQQLQLANINEDQHLTKFLLTFKQGSNRDNGFLQMIHQNNQNDHLEFYTQLFNLEKFYTNQNYQQYIALFSMMTVIDIPLKNVINHLIWKNLIKSYFRIGRYSNIVTFFETNKMEWYDSKIALLHAKSLYKCDKLKKAQQLFEELVELKTDANFESNMYLGCIHYKHGLPFYHKSQRLFQKIIKFSSNTHILSKTIYLSLKVAVAIQDSDNIKNCIQLFQERTDLQNNQYFAKSMILHLNLSNDFSTALLLCNHAHLNSHQKTFNVATTLFNMSKNQAFVGDKQNLLSEQLKLLKTEFMRLFYGSGLSALCALPLKCSKIVQVYSDIIFHQQKNQPDTTQVEYLSTLNFLCHQMIEYSSKYVDVNLSLIRLLNVMAKTWLSAPIFHMQNYQQIQIINTLIIYIDASTNYLSGIFTDVEDVNQITLVVETKYLKAMIYQYVATIRSDNTFLQQAKQLFIECADYYIIYDLQKYEEIQSKILMCDPDLYGIMVRPISDDESDED
jgi:hypothetical protein